MGCWERGSEAGREDEGWKSRERAQPGWGPQSRHEHRRCYCVAIPRPATRQGECRGRQARRCAAATSCALKRLLPGPTCTVPATCLVRLTARAAGRLLQLQQSRQQRRRDPRSRGRHGGAARRQLPQQIHRLALPAHARRQRQLQQGLQGSPVGGASLAGGQGCRRTRTVGVGWEGGVVGRRGARASNYGSGRGVAKTPHRMGGHVFAAMAPMAQKGRK